MKISIITAVYNNAEYIEECINSVLSQSYKDIEYIVVDGGSEDGTADIIKKYESRISKFISEKDDGIYDALNKGIKSSSGNVIGLLHADDIFADNEVLEIVADEFNRKTVDCLYGDLLYVRKNDTTKVVRNWRSGEFNKDKVESGWMPPHPALFIKKDLYERFGYFDTSYKIAADYDLILRILRSENLKIEYLPKVLTKMRSGGVSNRDIKNIIKKSREDYSALCKNNVRKPFNALVKKNFSKLTQFINK